MSNSPRQEEKLATQEWVAIQSAFINDVVLLGKMFGIELYPKLTIDEETGAIIPALKMRDVPKGTPEEIEESKKIYLERKKEHYKMLGEKNLDSITIFGIEVSPGKLELTDQAKKDAYWESYQELEKVHECGFLPLLVGEKTGIHPTYEIIPKPVEEKKPKFDSQPVSEEKTGV